MSNTEYKAPELKVISDSLEDVVTLSDGGSGTDRPVEWSIEAERFGF